MSPGLLGDSGQLIGLELRGLVVLRLPGFGGLGGTLEVAWRGGGGGGLDD